MTVPMLGSNPLPTKLSNTFMDSPVALTAQENNVEPTVPPAVLYLNYMMPVMPLRASAHEARKL